jgi:hypothetical protein
MLPLESYPDCARPIINFIVHVKLTNKKDQEKVRLGVNVTHQDCKIQLGII